MMRQSIVILGLVLLGALVPVCAEPQASELPPRVQLALQCSVLKDPAFAKLLGLEGQRSVELQYWEGGIPHTSEMESLLPRVALVYFSKDRRKAIVTSDIVTPTAQVLQDLWFPWYLQRVDEHWQASSGAGGPGLLQRVSDLVNRLAVRRTVRFELPAKGSATCVPASIWNSPDSQYLDFARIKK